MKTTIIFFFLLLLFSCKPKQSERDKQVMENLKQDIAFKLDACMTNEIICRSRIQDPSKAERMMKYYLFQSNLNNYFKMLKTDSLINQAIDSLNTKITNWNKYLATSNYSKLDKNDMIIKSLEKVKINDSLDFMFLQNIFLFKILELQNKVNSGYTYHKMIFNYFKVLNLQQIYNLNDSITAYLMPYDNDNFYQFKIKVFRENKLVFKGLQNQLIFNYKPTKKGKYTIYFDSDFYNDNNFCYTIENDCQISEFEVK